MNIVHALDAALPELPERIVRRDKPRLDPRVITKEHIEHGSPVVIAKLPGTEIILRFAPEQWKLIQLFDGNRSYQELSELSAETTGILFREEDVREIASFLYDNTDFISKTPLEKKIILKQELQGQRRKKRKRFRITDFTDITLKEWPNSDRYITRLYPWLKFIYTPQFVFLSLFLFAVMVWMWADKFGEIWSDSFEFYNFTSKSGTDLIEFWFLFAAMAFFHETAHGLTCKHFGGNVEKMGFTLMYFAPSFFCDASQVWIYGGQWERIATAIAGIWIDLIICVVATFVWWGTATGMLIHDLAYKVMMVTGIGVSLLNLNPLIKLDGYLIFCELTHEPDLKEKSTAYLSGLLRKKIFGLPVEIDFVPKRRRVFYVVYAILSGLYGYVLLSFLMVLTFHILRSYSPDWAFVPAIAAGYWVFKSRIHMLVRFMKIVYLDKKERVKAWLTAPHLAVVSVIGLIIALLPIWPDFVQGQFVLEPVRRVTLRAEVPGRVVTVLAREGQQVTAGQTLLELKNLQLQSASASNDADLQVASDRVNLALLNYDDLGPVRYQQQEIAQRGRTLANQVTRLRVNSPITGVVATPRVDDLMGMYLAAGTPMVQISDVSAMNARIYIPEFAMRDIRVGATVRMQVESRVLPFTAILLTITPSATEIEPGLVSRDQLKGITAPLYYVGTVLLPNPGDLREGMTGTAKILVRRDSIARFAWTFTRDLVDRRVW